MSSTSKSNSGNPIIIDPQSLELEAWFGSYPLEPARSGLARMALWTINHARHQAAVFAYATILIALWSSDVRAQHTVILSLAVTSIATVAVFTEWVGGKYYDHSKAKR